MGQLMKQVMDRARELNATLVCGGKIELWIEGNYCHPMFSGTALQYLPSACGM